MNVRCVRRFLWLASAALTAGVAAVLMLGAWLPLAGSSNSRATAITQPTTAPAGEDTGTQLEAVLAAAQVSLRRPLVDPAPPPPRVEPPRPLPVKLVGTMLETGARAEQSKALLTGSDGKLHLMGRGELLDGAELVQIGADSVTVRFEACEHTLKLPDKHREGG